MKFGKDDNSEYKNGKWNTLRCEITGANAFDYRSVSGQRDNSADIHHASQVEEKILFDFCVPNFDFLSISNQYTVIDLDLKWTKTSTRFKNSNVICPINLSAPTS